MDNPIHKYRERQGLRQLELALLLEVSEMSVSHWERGARIPPEKIIARLAEILKIDPKILNKGLRSYYEVRKEELKGKLGLQT